MIPQSKIENRKSKIERGSFEHRNDPKFSPCETTPQKNETVCQLQTLNVCSDSPIENRKSKIENGIVKNSLSL